MSAVEEAGKRAAREFEDEDEEAVSGRRRLGEMQSQMLQYSGGGRVRKTRFAFSDEMIKLVLERTLHLKPYLVERSKEKSTRWDAVVDLAQADIMRLEGFRPTHVLTVKNVQDRLRRSKDMLLEKLNGNPDCELSPLERLVKQFADETNPDRIKIVPPEFTDPTPTNPPAVRPEVPVPAVAMPPVSQPGIASVPLDVVGVVGRPDLAEEAPRKRQRIAPAYEDLVDVLSRNTAKDAVVEINVVPEGAGRLAALEKRLEHVEQCLRDTTTALVGVQAALGRLQGGGGGAQRGE